MSANDSSAGGRPRREKANLHPGRIILDTQNKRRTPAEKKADDVYAEEVKNAREAALQQGRERVHEMEATMAVTQNAKGAVRAMPVKPKPRVRQRRPTSTNTGAAAPRVDGGEYNVLAIGWILKTNCYRLTGTTEMEVDTDLVSNNPTFGLTGSSDLMHKPSSNGISASRSNVRPLKRHNAMATLADVAVEEQESARVQEELKVLLHQLCVLFGLSIMLLLLTESTLYWLNRISTPRPPNKRARLLSHINNWSNEVEVDDGDGTPPNTLASNSLTSETTYPPSSAAPSSTTIATTVSSAKSVRKVADKHPSKVGLYLLISFILHSFLGHSAQCAPHRPRGKRQRL